MVSNDSTAFSKYGIVIDTLFRKILPMCNENNWPLWVLLVLYDQPKCPRHDSGGTEAGDSSSTHFVKGFNILKNHFSMFVELHLRRIGLPSRLMVYLNDSDIFKAIHSR